MITTRRHAGTRQRQVDVPEHLKVVAAVDPRGVAEFARQAEEERPHQENGEGGAAADIGQRQPGKRIEQMQRLQELEHRDEDRLRRDHHRADEGVEDHLASGKPVAREGVGRRGRECDHQRDRQARDIKRVGEMDRKVHREPDARKVLPLDLAWAGRVLKTSCESFTEVTIIHTSGNASHDRDRHEDDVDERASEGQPASAPARLRGERCGSMTMVALSVIPRASHFDLRVEVPAPSETDLDRSKPRC